MSEKRINKIPASYFIGPNGKSGMGGDLNHLRELAQKYGNVPLREVIRNGLYNGLEIAAKGVKVKSGVEKN